MRTGAHINIFALLIKGKTGRLRKIGNVFNFEPLAALVQKCDCIGTRKFKCFNLKIFFCDFFHFGFDSGQIVFANFYTLAKRHIIIKAVFGSRTVGKVCVGIQALYCLSQQVRTRMANGVSLFFL